MAKIPFKNFFTTSPSSIYANDGKIATVGRPRDTRYGSPVHEFERLYAIPRLPLAYITMFSAYYQCAPWKFSGNLKVQEKYRRGLVVIPNFEARCDQCDIEFQDYPEDFICPKCGKKLRTYDQEEFKEAKQYIKNVNLNHESLRDLMETTAHDIVVSDEGYHIYRKEYLADGNGNIKWQRLKEVVVGSPIVMRPVVDHHTGTPGGVYYVCPGEHRQTELIHREKNTNDQYARQAGGTNYETDDDAPRCSKCGLVMQDVKYVSIFHERGEIENYYIDGEVCHWHEYDKNHTFVVPPAVTLWVPISILTYKDAYIRDSFMKQRKPRGALVASTSNPDGFMNMWKQVMEEVKKDWQYMPVIPMEPEPGMGSGSNRIAWVDFMGTMQDLDYEHIRNIYERTIYQFYGVSNIFANLDTAAAGKGGLEAKLIINNKHVERSNNVDNEKPLARLTLEKGLKECHFEVAPFEDRDVMKELQLDTHKINNAQMMEYLGFRTIRNPVNKKLSFEKDTEKELTRAINIMNSLVSPITGQVQGSQPEEKPQVSAKPETNEDEFSNMSTDMEKALGDKSMHEGDTKPTPESVNRTKAPGAKPSGGYTAPDGSVWPSKQAYGGHQRTLGSTSGVGGGTQGGAGGMGMGMATADKDDYKKALGLMRRFNVTEPYILDMMDEMVEEMNEGNDILGV